MKKFKWLLVLMSLSCQLYALDAEHVLWDKTPISIDLSLNDERLIHFPQAISIIDNEASDNITVLKAQGSLYLRGKKPFMNKRLFIQLMPQGEVVILNLSAKEKIK